MAARVVGVLSLGWLAMLVGCGQGDSPSVATPATSSQVTPTSSPAASSAPKELRPGTPLPESPAQLDAAPEDPIVELDTSVGKIRLRLFAQQAPQTVANFLDNYVSQHRYDGTLVHFADPEFMIALGGFDANYQPIETAPAILNEADNGLHNVKGTVAMARMPEYAHSATSQFFINVADNQSLDYAEQEDGAINGYCVFGEVIEGMDVVQSIASAPTTDRPNFPSTPNPAVVVRSVRVVGSIAVAPVASANAQAFEGIRR